MTSWYTRDYDCFQIIEEQNVFGALSMICHRKTTDIAVNNKYNEPNENMHYPLPYAFACHSYVTIINLLYW